MTSAKKNLMIEISQSIRSAEIKELHVGREVRGGQTGGGRQGEYPVEAKG